MVLRCRLLLVLLAGCGPDYLQYRHDAIKQEYMTFMPLASEALACPPERMGKPDMIRESGPRRTYRVEGCGQVVTFACDTRVSRETEKIVPSECAPTR